MKNNYFVFLLFLIVVISNAWCNDKSNEKFFPVYTTDAESVIVLDFKTEFALEYVPEKVQVDCTCSEAKLVEKEDRHTLEFTLKWKDRLMIPVVFAFASPDGKIEKRTAHFVKMTHAQKPSEPLETGEQIENSDSKKKHSE